MPILPTKTKKTDVVRAARVKRTAELCGVSTSLVYKVLEWKRRNELVVSVYMTLGEMERDMESQMVEIVKELVPFDQVVKKTGRNCAPCVQKMIA